MELNVGVFFDGTGNNRTKDGDSMSNVGKLSYLYRDDSEQYPVDARIGHAMLYVRGVGTESDGEEDPIDNDFGEWQVLGAGVGKGGRERLAYNLRRLDNLLGKDIDSVILDVFGFSRGAALARAFVNIVNEKRFDNSFKRLKACPSLKVRFVGIYDTVGSFSLPGDDKDPYNFHLDTTKARYIYHITAQDELRKNFDLQSLKRKPGEVLVFPIEETRCWMVEEAMPGVHSDVGGGYSSSPEQGNDNNELSRIYLEKMHRVAVRQEVPLHPLALLESIPGRRIPWKVDKTLQDNFATLMGTYANDARLVRLHQHLKDAQRRLEVVNHRLEIYANRRLSKSMGVKKYKHQKPLLTNLVKWLQQHITDECFAGDNAKARQFFNLYANFRRKYIHLSHSPFNKTHGMSPGMVERDQKSKLVKLANRAGVAKGLLKIYGRDIFMNDNDSATQMIKSHNSFTCHLKFVSKENNDVTLPANVHIEVWDNDLGPDDRLGAGDTDEQGEVSILCFDISARRDVYFAFEGQDLTFSDNKTPLPEEWESKDHDAFKKGNKFVVGCLDKYSKQELGSKGSPFIVYV